MSKVMPITPQEVLSKKVESIPDVVIEAFNTLIALNYSNGHAQVKQSGSVRFWTSTRQTSCGRTWLS
jgi:hypothetical protein